jgi:hypothetical protein
MPLPVFEVAIIINQPVWSIGPTIALPFPRGVGSGIDKTAMESNLSWTV